MASIGELTATVRADISGYVGPMKQVTATNQQVAASVTSTVAPIVNVGERMTETAGQGAQWGHVMEHVQRVATLLGVEASGLGLHFGRLAASIGPMIGQAGVFALAAVGIGLVAKAFENLQARAEAAKKPLEDAQKVIHDILTTSESPGREAQATLGRELGRQIKQLNQLREQLQHPAGGTGPGRGLSEDDLRKFYPEYRRLAESVENLRSESNSLNLVLNVQEAAANRTATAHHALSNASREAAARARELAQAMQDIKTKGQEAVEHSSDKKPELLTKEAAAWDHLKDSILATQAAEERRLVTSTREQGIKAASAVKDVAKDASESLNGVAKSAAEAVSHGFISAFKDGKKDLMTAIADTLRDAILAAIGKLIEEKVFDALLKAFSPNKGIGSTLLGNIPVIGQLFAPPAPQGSLSGSATIVVPTSQMPPALSPVQHARDAQWQYLFGETARVAQANGVRLVTV